LTEDKKPCRQPFFDGLWRSFGQEEFYVRVARDWQGFALRYLLLVSIVFALLVAAGRYIRTMDFLESPACQKMFAGMPDCRLQNAVLSTAGSRLVELRLADRPGNVLVIDSQDKLCKFEDAHALVLLQSKQITIGTVSGHRPIKTGYRRFFQDGEISGAGIIKLLRGLVNAAVLPVAVVLIIYTVLTVLAKSMLLAFLLRLFGLSHTFAAATRLIVAASTPSMLLSGAAVLLNMHFGSFEDPLFTTIFFVYVIFAFRACRRQKIDRSADSTQIAS
jgi:hypothetical protein